MIAKYKCLHCGDILDPEKIYKMTYCACNTIAIDTDKTIFYVRVAGEKVDYEVLKE